MTAFIDQTIYPGEQVRLYGIVNASGIDSSLVTWTTLNPFDGQTNVVVQGAIALEGYTTDSIYENTIYILSLNNGCGDTSSVLITVDQNESIFIPNAFTPNGDGNNDIFTVYASKDVRQINKLMVFDRWGELVHSTENFPASSLDPSHGWDGRFQGKM